MRRFESIVMSETEPVPDGTLWLKKKKNSISNDDPSSKEPFGFDMWWFGPLGWQPLLDLDTRYEYINNTLTGSTSIVPVATAQTKYPDLGTIEVKTTYSIYNGNRALSNNTNLVNETGLKKHVDDLQSQITALVARVSTLENKVSTLEGKVTTLESNVNTNSSKITSNTNAINSLSNRVSVLETA